MRESWSLLNLGRHWYYLVIFYNSWFVMLVVSLIAYMAARLNAKTLPSSPFPLLAAFGLLFLFSRHIDFEPAHLHTLESMVVSSGALMSELWTLPLGIFAAALIASFLPFARVEPRPTMFQRFLALLRDGSFFSLTLISIAFYATSLNLHELEQRILAERGPDKKPAVLSPGRAPVGKDD